MAELELILNENLVELCEFNDAAGPITSELTKYTFEFDHNCKNLFIQSSIDNASAESPLFVKKYGNTCLVSYFFEMNDGRSRGGRKFYSLITKIDISKLPNGRIDLFLIEDFMSCLVPKYKNLILAKQPTYTANISRD